MVEVLGVGLSLHKVIVILGHVIVNRLDGDGFQRVYIMTRKPLKWLRDGHSDGTECHPYP